MKNDDDNAVAIVAIECRLPGASNVDQLWELLLQGECTIQELSDDQLQEAGIPTVMRSQPAYVRRAGVLEDVDKFDEAYFDMSSREADVLDVQQRLMLEAAVTLLNRGNIDPSRSDQKIGVFAGSAFSSYLFGVIERADLMDSLGEMLVRHSNDKDFLATRISYKLNLVGPSLNVQTSCSTGLVAVHLAIQSLLLGECDLAMAGAVCVKLPQSAGYKYQADGVLSPDGLCRPFDAEAKGTIFTNGLGLVLLKRLSDAVADGDEVIAVIAGSAINNDGARKVGFTAPSIIGQVEALSSALTLSGLHPSRIQYIEAHGTGTMLGDPIEVEAIKQAYGTTGQRCGIGSLKGNFGHSNIAAGVIGLIKAALVVKHGVIPRTLHFHRVNPQLTLDGTRFFVTDRQIGLDTDVTRYAAVSAFGMGGTNCHAVLRSHDISAPTPSALRHGPQLFVFSAKNLSALDRMSAQYAQHLGGQPDLQLADAAYTAYFARPVMTARAAVVACNTTEAAKKLAAGDFYRGIAVERHPLAFVFGGQGTQHIRMGQDLAKQCPVFSQHLGRALKALEQTTGRNLSDCLWQDDREEDLIATNLAQPLIFAVEYALAVTLIDAGVQPSHLVGHSLGEVVAATVSGVFDLQTAAEVVAKRAQFMAACTPGAMLCVDDIEAFESMIRSGELSLAAHNTPRQHVLAGTSARIEVAVRQAEQQGIAHQRLRTSHAFHSPMMQDAARAFLDFMSTLAFGQASIPLISNITGQRLGEYEYRNPVYWSEHLVQTVRFSACVDTLWQLGVRHFIEVGHGYAMGNLVRANLPAMAHREAVIAHAMGAVDDEYGSFLNTIAMASTVVPGLDIDPYIPVGRKIAMPVYPFARNSHWVKPTTGFQRQDKPLPAVPPRPFNHVAQPALASDEVSGTTPLPPPVAAMVDSKQEPIEATNPVEAIVREVYCDFLGDSNLDHNRPFFDLGGNSLVAIQLINRLRETFQVDIPLRGFYQDSSIAAISRKIASLLLETPAHV